MSTPLSLGHVIVSLVSGPLYREDTDLWNRLRLESESVRRHYALMGLEVIIDEDAGYAYLRQADSSVENDNTDAPPLPRLLRRTPLGFHPTLLMVLLRERLLRHDQSAEGEPHLYLDDIQLADLLRPYYPASTDEKRTEAQISRAITRLKEIGILRPLPNRSETIYRIEPILRTKLPIQELASIRDRLLSHLGDPPTEEDSSASSPHTEEVASSDPSPQPDAPEHESITLNDTERNG